MKTGFYSPRITIGALSALMALDALPALAAVPEFLTYQGRVTENGTNFNGTGHFKFALVNDTGATTYWSNDGTSVAGSEPSASNDVVVTDGLFTVELGGAGMDPIPSSVFTNLDVRLRIWFDSGAGSQQLAPDQRLGSVGYAMRADGVGIGSITGEMLAGDAVTSDDLADASVGADQLVKKYQSGTMVVTNDAHFPTSPPFRTVDFPNPFSQTPIVTVSVVSEFADRFPGPHVDVTSQTVSNFTVEVSGMGPGNVTGPVTVDSPGLVGQYTSLAVVNGRPAISYYDLTGDDLRYVRATDADGTTWDSPVIADANGDVGNNTSLIDLNGAIAIAHYDNTSDDLKFFTHFEQPISINWIAVEP